VAAASGGSSSTPLGVLAARLNVLRAATGMSLRELQQHTHTSDSSLSRYFAGRIRPPWSVVETLCALANQDPAELRRLWMAAAVRMPAPLPAASAAPAPNPPLVPRQLPAAPRHFVGRSDVADAMARSLSAQGGALFAITGVGGIGKTSLALAWSHRMVGRFPDGQLYLNLRGFDPCNPPMTPTDAVTELLHALGVPPQRLPDTHERRLAAYRTLTADKKVLLVLDNAADSDQVRGLLPAGPECLTIVTSRNRLAGLIAGDGAQPLSLGPLSDDEAFTFLEARLGARRVEAEREALRSLVASCAGLPLALSILAARLALEPALDAAVLAARLRDDRAALSELDVGETTVDVRAVFSWSYQRLSPDAAALFIRLGLHPGPTVSVETAAVLAPAPLTATAAIHELEAAHLLMTGSDGRLRFHDLIRLYAAELAESELDQGARHDVRRQILDHYLHTAFHADRAIFPVRPAIVLSEPHPRSAPEVFDGPAGAAAWMHQERDVLVAATTLAAQNGFPEHAIALPWALTIPLDRAAAWRTMADLARLAVTAAEELGDRAASARAHCDLGYALQRMGDEGEALSQLEQARTIWGGLGDRPGLARVERNLAIIHESRGTYAEALTHAVEALRHSRAAGPPNAIAAALTAVAWFHVLCGQFDEALARAGEALAMHRAAGNGPGEASVLNTMAMAYQRLGRLDEAMIHYRSSAKQYADQGDRYYEALALARIAEVQDTLGEEELARATRETAWLIVDELGLSDDEPFYKQFPLTARR
jgi:tetratricopeptide (TPR) repeat protein